MFKALCLLFALTLCGLAAGGNWLWNDMQRSLAEPLAIETADFQYTVQAGASVREITLELVEAGVLTQPYYLELEARRQGIASRIKAGEYSLQAGITRYQLLDLLVQGKVVQYGVILIEGRTFRQFLAALAANDTLVHTLQDATLEQVMTRIDQSGAHPEGRFFPDTYHFSRGDSDVDVLKRAFEAMQRHLAEAWEQRAEDLPYDTPYEALTMASIIEKETGKAEERPRIAGVFVRRLRIDMKLQTDPTIIYALGEGLTAICGARTSTSTTHTTPTAIPG